MYVFAFIAFTTHSPFLSFIGVIYTFGMIPLFESFLPPSTENLEQAEEEMAKHNKLYDYVLYLIVFLQIPTLFFFLNSLTDTSLTTTLIVARVVTMGILCGTFGINVAHELGHRNNVFEQTLAKLNLLTSLYMHFFIEHNKGHHKHVATPDDPSSAPYKQSLYRFFIRTISGTYSSAWQIASDEIVKKGYGKWSIRNEMLQFQIVQLLFVGCIYFLFGGNVMLCFIAAATIGFLLLETVNYIEHYGLQRKPTTDGKFERALPQHSWNSNHIFGRLMLFELSRHSDHHYLASRKYQVLRHHDNAPQMPTGYPGMMLLSTIPPLFFWIMDKQMKKYGIENG